MAESNHKGMPRALTPKVPRPMAVDGSSVSIPAAVKTDVVPASQRPRPSVGPTGPASMPPPAHSGPAPSVPTIGERVGKYRIERLLGAGGMGLVVAARDDATGEVVAIKLLRPKSAGDKIHAERFAREARAITKITSDHVVRVLDAGALETGAPYIVMEYLVGKDLAQILREHGRMELPHSADLMLQICEAVASAHAVGVIHRDLKPSNFFVTERPDGGILVKVLDFGISKAVGQDGLVDPNLTETQAVFGSPTYMSPEQIRSAKHVDHRSDIWSLAVGMYEVFTGKLPFSADNVAGLLASVVADPPFYPRAFVPDLPQPLEDLLLACLQKHPAKRVQSMGDIAVALAPYASPTAETRGLVERVQMLSQSVSSGALPATPSGAQLPLPSSGRHLESPVTGPQLPSPTTGPHLPPPGGVTVGLPGSSIPWPANGVAEARSSGVTFVGTGTDLSGATPRPDRSVVIAVGAGITLALAIVCGLGAYWVGARRPVTSPASAVAVQPTSTLPAVSSASPIPSASSAPPVETAPPVAAATAAPTGGASAGASASVSKKVVVVPPPQPRHPVKPVPSASAAKPEVDPTKERF